MTVLFMTLALAAVIGFSLSLYFFHYRTNLAGTWRWLGGVFGGFILGGCLLLFTFVILAPPVDAWFTIAGLLIIGLITAIILLGGGGKRGKV